MGLLFHAEETDNIYEVKLFEENQDIVNPQSRDHGPQSYAAFLLPRREA
jgi:hypothetical protein